MTEKQADRILEIVNELLNCTSAQAEKLCKEIDDIYNKGKTND